jgi:hypothetical protein
VTIDHRKLLKDCVRGMIYEWDIPAALVAVDEHAEAKFSLPRPEFQ